MLKSLIVDTNGPITLLGGSRVEVGVVDRALGLAPNLVVADGGAQAALDLGLMPQAVIGDFDSVDANTIAQIPPERLFRINEQDSTDFDKCLRNIAAPYILAHGFTGRRLDHELAVYNALARHPDQRCVVLGEVDLCFLVTRQVRLKLPIGTRVSLFPIGTCQASATGLRWSFQDMAMAPDGKIGTSNEASDEEVTVQTTAPKLLMILPLAHLDAVIAAFDTT
ncbi:thiamine diphosphokinase [Profundibacter sp.]